MSKGLQERILQGHCLICIPTCPSQDQVDTKYSSPSHHCGTAGIAEGNGATLPSRVGREIEEPLLRTQRTHWSKMHTGHPELSPQQAAAVVFIAWQSGWLPLSTMSNPPLLASTEQDAPQCHVWAHLHTCQPSKIKIWETAARGEG